MTREKCCLISGASGFLGTAVAGAFSRAGYRLLGVDLRAPRTPEQWTGFEIGPLQEVHLDRLVGDDPPSVICHLAGSSAVGPSIESPYQDFDALMPGTAKLLAWNGKNGPKARVLLFSSAAVYGNPVRLPVDERCPIRPISPYGIHKATAEVLLEAYGRYYGFETIAMRIFSAYGPGLKRQVVWDIAQKALRAARGRDSELWLDGDGSETRDFVYVDDISDVALALATTARTDPGFVVNVASGTETTIRALATWIVNALGLDVNVRFSGVSRVGDPKRWLADISLLRAVVPVRLRALDAGLGSVVDWLRSDGGA